MSSNSKMERGTHEKASRVKIIMWKLERKFWTLLWPSCSNFMPYKLLDQFSAVRGGGLAAASPLCAGDLVRSPWCSGASQHKLRDRTRLASSQGPVCAVNPVHTEVEKAANDLTLIWLRTFISMEPFHSISFLQLFMSPINNTGFTVLPSTKFPGLCFLP